jgi:lysophospholipid acyltransferase
MWNRVRNVNIISLETAESFKVVFDNWNCRTNVSWAVFTVAMPK